MKPRIIHFDCRKNGVAVSTRVGSRFKVLGLARNIKGMKKLVEKIKLNDSTDTCMFSSSMDFPKEYTNNKAVLELVRKLNAPV